MADLGYTRSFLGGLDEKQKRAFTQLFDYLLKSWRVGLPGHQKMAQNMAWVQLDATTPSTANQEFAIAHGLGTAPRVLFPCLDLTTADTQMIPLTNSRAADGSYVYLKSSSTSAAFTIFAESR